MHTVKVFATDGRKKEADGHTRLRPDARVARQLDCEIILHCYITHCVDHCAAAASATMARASKGLVPLHYDLFTC